MLEEVGNAVCSQNPIMPCPFLLRAVENTAVYIILYININIYIYIYILDIPVMAFSEFPMQN